MRRALPRLERVAMFVEVVVSEFVCQREARSRRVLCFDAVEVAEDVEAASFALEHAVKGTAVAPEAYSELLALEDNRKILTPTILDTIVPKINEGEITNSKDVRKLRVVLRDPVAKDEFLSGGGTIQTALEKVGPSEVKRRRNDGLAGDVDALVESLKRA